MTTSSQTSSNGTDPDWDIVIVGMGPVGVTLAGLMGRFGHRVLAIDKEADVYDQPRAIGMDHETLRVFQQLGITKDLEPFVSDYKTTEHRSASGEVIRRFISQEPPFTLGWPPYQTFVQPDLERVLRAHVHEIDGGNIQDQPYADRHGHKRSADHARHSRHGQQYQVAADSTLCHRV